MSSQLRIGLDATSWLNRRGYGRFTRNLLERLVALDGDQRYVLLIDEESAHQIPLPRDAEVRRVALGRPPARAAAAGSRRSLPDLLRMSRAASGLDLAALLFPSVYTWFPVRRVPTVVGVHDLIAENLPSLTFSSRRARMFWNLKRSLAVRSARALFTVSEFSRTALARRLDVAPARIAVVPEAPDPVFHPRPAERCAEELLPLGLQAGEEFLLFAGGISPHKDLGTLLDAYAALGSGRGAAPRLVIVGALEDEPYLSDAAAVRAHIAARDLGTQVLLPGFVTDEALACLYSATVAMVSPSLAEGFGLPAVEAAACGAPVVLSDIGPHRESLADAALYFGPGDAHALAQTLGRVLEDHALRRSLSRRAQARVAPLSWDAAARRVRELLREVVRGG